MNGRCFKDFKKAFFLATRVVFIYAGSQAVSEGDIEPRGIIAIVGGVLIALLFIWADIKILIMKFKQKRKGSNPPS
jgi:hypothetical protein